MTRHAPFAPPSSTTLRWVERCLGTGSEVKLVRPLTGGASHANHALLAESRSGTMHRLVLRRWVHSDRTVIDTDFSPEREIAALALLAGCEIPTPALVAADPSGAYCSAPALLITRLAGHLPRPTHDDTAEHLIQLAAALLPVHTVDGAATMPPYLPFPPMGGPPVPEHARRPALWERAVDAATAGMPTARPRFIHGDYQPDNTLWAHGRLTGIVDWTTASYGPVAVDVAHMRLSLAVHYDVSIADRFLDAFDQVSGGYRHDPYWDLRAVIDLLPERHARTTQEAHIDVLEDYLERLLAELGLPAR